MIDTILQFSGGKDSLACLYLYKEQWDNILVVWVNTGASFPETIRYMEEWKKILPHFLELKTQQEKQIENKGFPVDVIPIWYTKVGQSYKGQKEIKLQHTLDCCAENIWYPLHNFVIKSGIKKVIRGQRNEEKYKNPNVSGSIDENGIEYIFPIQHWTLAEVLNYLTQIKAYIPDYHPIDNISRDCWNCTGFWDVRKQQVKRLEGEDKILLQNRLKKIHEVIMFETKFLEELL